MSVSAVLLTFNRREMTARVLDELAAHGASAPSAIERAGSGTISSGSISRCEPRPVQRSQAPCGELNEKILGSSSGIDVPHFTHAKRSENVRSVLGGASCLAL